MGELGNKYWFRTLSPQQQKRIVSRDARGEGAWTIKISKLAIDNAQNLGKDRDEELKDILDEEIDL